MGRYVIVDGIQDLYDVYSQSKLRNLSEKSQQRAIPAPRVTRVPTVTERIVFIIDIATAEDGDYEEQFLIVSKL